MKTATIQKPLGRVCACKQCLHEWEARVQGRDPLICPSCRTWYWQADPDLISQHERDRIIKHLKEKQRKRRR